MDRTAILPTLRAAPLFRGVADDHLKPLAAKARARVYDPDDTLFWAGDPGGTMYLIVSGRVAIEKPDPDDKVKTISIRGPGEVIGELSLFVDGRRTADARAIERTEVVIVDGAQVDALIDESPPLARNVISLLASKLAESTERYVETGRKVLSRLAAALVKEVRAAAVKDGEGRRIVPNPPSQRELAERLNCSREHVNKAFRQLREDGILDLDGKRLVVLDPQALKRLGE